MECHKGFDHCSFVTRQRFLNTGWRVFSGFWSRFFAQGKWGGARGRGWSWWQDAKVPKSKLMGSQSSLMGTGDPRSPTPAKKNTSSPSLYISQGYGSVILRVFFWGGGVMGWIILDCYKNNSFKLQKPEPRKKSSCFPWILAGCLI